MADTPLADFAAAGVPNLVDLIPKWQAAAACNGAGPEVFFSERVVGRSNLGVEAKALFCAGCPVLVDCLEHAVVYPEGHGIWGGCGEQELRWFRRIRADRPHAGADLVDGCRCRWCVELVRHRARLRVMSLPVGTRGRQDREPGSRLLAELARTENQNDVKEQS